MTRGRCELPGLIGHFQRFAGADSVCVNRRYLGVTGLAEADAFGQISAAQIRGAGSQRQNRAEDHNNPFR